MPGLPDQPKGMHTDNGTAKNNSKAQKPKEDREAEDSQEPRKDSEQRQSEKAVLPVN